jgi:hypothetical protein
LKGAIFISGSSSKLAFVSTNSITQGEQVALLWPLIFAKEIEICFAHKSFKWSNSAKGNAGVICVVIGLSVQSSGKKVVYSSGISQEVSRINAYLRVAPDVFIYRRSSPISKIPQLVFGNMPNDGGHLILSKIEKEQFVKLSDGRAEKYIKKYMGAKEFLQGTQRYCLWIDDESLSDAMSIDCIKERIESVAENRLNSKRPATCDLASNPHKFGYISHKNGDAILVPSATSERREYIPIGLVDDDTIINNLAHAIYNVEPYVFALISSRMHMVWIKAIAGRLKSDYRYSGAICYNNFPVPEFSTVQRELLEDIVFSVIEERERYPEKTMAQLYDPEKMPTVLRELHRSMDLAVDNCYRSKMFNGDDERLEYLFKLYEEFLNA